MTEAKVSVMPEAPQPASSDSLWLYALFALLATAGFFYVNIMAAIVDGLITGLGFSNVQAGMVGSANIYGASLGALVSVFIVRHVQWKTALGVLLGLLLVIDLASTSIHVPAVLIPVRALHGFIGGMSVGVVYSVMARLRSPDRAFGMLLVLQFGLGGLGVMFLPSLVPTYGAKILFLVLAGLTAIALVSMLAIPRSIAANNAPRIADALPASYRVLTVVLALLALFLFQAGNMALFAFIIPLGESFALGLAFISRTLAWATWVGVLGAVLVIAMGTKMGRVRPLLAAMTLTVVGVALLAWSHLPLLFFAANAGTAITWAFVVPLLFGMISVLDPSGRLTTLAGFMSGLGLASGPMLAGLVAHTGNYLLLIGVAVALLVLSSVATLSSAQRVDAMDRRRPKEATPA